MKAFKICFIAITCLLVCVLSALAQTDADAIMIPKNNFCIGSMYSYSAWTNYWEGTFKRDNQNIGKLTTNTYALMGNYGITNKLNVMFTAPFVITNASSGTLEGQRGLQDLSFAVKWVPVSIKQGRNTFRLFTVAKGVIPLSNYEADFLPVAIGLHCKSVALRLIADYQVGKFYINGSGEYMRRDNITIDRDAYYTTEMHYTNQVAIPDGNDFSFHSGYRSSTLIAELVLESSTTLGGFDIRKNDMPFPSNRMNMTMIGANFKYSFTRIKGLELTAGADRVIDGRNVGQSTMLMGGAYYLFSLSKKGNK